MMEESSDESAEIISNEEAELAKKMQDVAEVASGSLSKVVSSISPPAPLPSFINSPTTSPPVQQTTPSHVNQTPVEKVDFSPKQKESQPTNPTILKPQPAAPAPIQSPLEASSQIPVPNEMLPDSPKNSNEPGGGLFGWIGGGLVNKVMEKTKSSMESVITTLDPGMREVIRTGGDVYVIVTSEKDSKVCAVREAFQTVFGKAIVQGMTSTANTAPQPVGYTSGLKGAEERIENLRKKGTLQENQTIVSVEGFIVELLPDRWYEMSCLILQDPSNRIELRTFSQPCPIPAEYILKAQDKTASDYPLRWSGLAVTIGQIVEEALPHIGRSDWQLSLTGVSRRESLTMAARTLAYMYKQRLPNAVI